MTDLNECRSNPCLNGATCYNLPDDYGCTCAPGYTEYNCNSDVDECATNVCGANGHCLVSTNCSVLGTVFYLTFTFFPSGSLDPSLPPSLPPSPPPPPPQNTAGGYTCACDPGFTGTNCERNINDCNPDPCLNGGTCFVSDTCQVNSASVHTFFIRSSVVKPGSTWAWASASAKLALLEETCTAPRHGHFTRDAVQYSTPMAMA